MEKIKNYIIKNFKPILFCLIFISVCFVYNINNQNINYFFKKGSILEYSAQNVDKDAFLNILSEQKIKNVILKQEGNSFFVAIPIQIDKNKKELVNNISNYIFDNYPNSKLKDIKPLNDNYHKPYNTFLKFFELLIISSFIWIILLFLFSNDKKLAQKAKESLFNCFKKEKESLLAFLKKTKEKGFIYFLKKILFDEAKDENGNEKEINFTKEIINTILFVVICVILIRFFIGELRWIPSGSMRPTILERDRVFVQKLDFPKKEIKRGDILVFYPPEVQLKNDVFSIFSRLSGIFCKDIAFIKRTIGMPNDKFEVKYDEKKDEFQIYINDEPLNEPYIISKKGWTPCNESMYCGPFIIPEGQYFMMGDNRGNSQDSRFWGTLPKERVIGRANFMFWPISRINVLTDKYIELYSEKQNDKLISKKYLLNRYEFL